MALRWGALGPQDVERAAPWALDLNVGELSGAQLSRARTASNVIHCKPITLFVI